MDREIRNCLDVIQEECAEIIKVVSKIERFGFYNAHPKNNNIDNLTLLAQEFGDLLGAIDKFKDLHLTAEASAHFDAEAELTRRIKPQRIDKFYEVSKRNEL
jgi:hypothetical protein